MEASVTDLGSGKKLSGELTVPAAVAANLDRDCLTAGRVEDQQLIDTAADRNLLQDSVRQRNHAANALASGRRAVRLLWIALVVSLAAHLIVPVFLVTALVRPEKVALMD